MSHYDPFLEEVVVIEEKEKKEHQLILHNDDFNTFQWVIECLMTVCNHEERQAEQCSWIVHNNGRCTIKEGSYSKLKPMKEGLQDKGLSVTIE